MKAETLLHLYKALVKPRLIEEKMLILLRQGRISKWFSGIGQEAISVGVTEALKSDELIFTMHRNLGVFTSRNISTSQLFAQWQGKKEGFTKGRDRSFHFGAPEFGIIGMISHLGPQLSLAAGAGLAARLKNEKKVAVAFTGEGGTSQGEFHEALNVAAVWNLPVIFIIENNGYGLSTTTSEQYKCEKLADKGPGYGMKSIVLNGNDVLEVYSKIKQIAEEIREKPEPWLVECMTFRMRGHEEASGTKYVPKELMEDWAKKDPILLFEQKLLKDHVLTKDEMDQIQQNLKSEIHSEVEKVFGYSEPVANIEEELLDVYAPFTHREENIPLVIENRSIRFVDAISEGLNQAMEKYPELIFMGQDIAEYGGVFKVTEGMVDKFGKSRVRNTPLCESAIIGASLGLSICGMKSMVEMQFADFVSVGFNQIVNNLAKTHYRWGQNADVVIRMPTGGGVAAGPFHSQSNEAWFTHTPGLKVVYPSNPLDAKGLLLAAFEDPNPVLYFEHKALYRSSNGLVPLDYYTIPIGKAKMVSNGSDLTLITYGMGVIWAEDVINELKISVDLVDLRSLLPLDWETIEKSVQKTGKVLILHEDTMFGGLGGEIAAQIGEKCFEYLDGPVVRVAGLDTPIPFSPILESEFLPKKRLKSALQKLLAY
jgi:2-oxoisovalerate dehydrogenase E1 component